MRRNTKKEIMKKEQKTEKEVDNIETKKVKEETIEERHRKEAKN